MQVWVFALLRGYQVTRALAGGAVDSMYIACFPTTKAQVFKRSFPLVFGEVEVLLLVRYTTLSSSTTVLLTSVGSRVPSWMKWITNACPSLLSLNLAKNTRCASCRAASLAG